MTFTISVKMAIILGLVLAACTGAGVVLLRNERGDLETPSADVAEVVAPPALRRADVKRCLDDAGGAATYGYLYPRAPALAAFRAAADHGQGGMWAFDAGSPYSDANPTEMLGTGLPGMYFMDSESTASAQAALAPDDYEAFARANVVVVHTGDLVPGVRDAVEACLTPASP